MLYNSSEKEESKNNDESEAINQDEQNELDKEAEELKKLEEEVARLTKETQNNLEKPDNIGEVSIINEQTIMVNGKLKRKKKKKKKRKKMGGGEETIANITVDEVSIDQKEEMEEKSRKLNPPKKRHKKPKTKNTPLGVVEEDSKEQSVLTDFIKSNTLDSQKFKEMEEDVESPAVKPQGKSRFSMSQLPTLEAIKPNEDIPLNKANTQIEQVNAINPKPLPLNEDNSNEKEKWKFPEDEGIMPVDFDAVDVSSPSVKSKNNENIEAINKVKVNFDFIYKYRISKVQVITI